MPINDEKTDKDRPQPAKIHEDQRPSKDPTLGSIIRREDGAIEVSNTFEAPDLAEKKPKK